MKAARPRTVSGGGPCSNIEVLWPLRPGEGHARAVLERRGFERVLKRVGARLVLEAHDGVTAGHALVDEALVVELDGAVLAEQHREGELPGVIVEIDVTPFDDERTVRRRALRGGVEAAAVHPQEREERVDRRVGRGGGGQRKL